MDMSDQTRETSSKCPIHGGPIQSLLVKVCLSDRTKGVSCTVMCIKERVRSSFRQDYAKTRNQRASNTHQRKHLDTTRIVAGLEWITTESLCEEGNHKHKTHQALDKIVLDQFGWKVQMVFIFKYIKMKTLRPFVYLPFLDLILRRQNSSSFPSKTQPSARPF